MSFAALLVVILGLGVIAWGAARLRAVQVRGARARTSSLPGHSGWYAALWTAVPPLLFLALWAALSPALVTRAVIASPAAVVLPATGFVRASILAEARATAQGYGGTAIHPASVALAPAYAAAQHRYGLVATAVALLLAFAGGAFAATRVRAGFAPRPRLERLIMAGLLAASLLAVLTTIGIAASLLYESVRFFRMVPIGDFLFGTHWSPQVVDPADPGASLGAVPLFWGTFFIGGVIAMAVAVPLGLMSAIYLTQYAAPRTRAWAKPMLEVLAGIPTVVYGYFAALTVAPRVRDLGQALGMENASSESALAAGLVMGAMIIPFVSSVADDALAAVPASLRDGSLAMGATPSETCRRVLLPAALPGIAGGILLAVSRAIGETMIVVMAASGVATLTANPFESTTTVTRQIVDLLTGEGAFDSPKTLAASALGLTLFAATFLLNVVALAIVKRYRQAYD